MLQASIAVVSIIRGILCLSRAPEALGSARRRQRCFALLLGPMALQETRTSTGPVETALGSSAWLASGVGEAIFQAWWLTR